MTYRFLLSLLVVVLGIMTLRSVRAQEDMDEDLQIVAEEMAIEEALSDDLLEAEDDLLDFYTEEDAEDALSEAIGKTVPVADSADDVSPDPAAELMVDEEDANPLADLEVAPVPDADALEDAAVEVEETAFDAPIAEAIAQPIETDVTGDALSDLEVEDVPAVAAEPEAEPEAPSEQDLLSDIELEDVSADASADDFLMEGDTTTDAPGALDDLAIEDAPLDDEAMPDDLRAFEDGATEKGVPAELLAEETALSDALDDVADLGADDLMDDADALDGDFLSEPADDALVDDALVDDALVDDALVDDADAVDDDFLSEPAESAMRSRSLSADAADDDLADDDMIDDDVIDDDVAAKPELPTAAIEELLEAEANFENGVGADDRPVPEVRVDRGMVGAAGAELDDEVSRSIRLLDASQELQRQAIYEHTLILLEEGEKANKAFNHTRARERFEKVLATLHGMGDRPEIRQARSVAEIGVTESMVGRAQALFEEGDLENALKLASDASKRGHRGASRLAGRIRKEMEDPEPVIPKIVRRPDQTDFLNNQKNIRTRLREGREHYMVGEYDQAQLEFESILNMDPHNTEAIRWRAKVSQRKYDRASMELESTRRDMIQIVRDTWNPRSYKDMGDDGGPGKTSEKPPPIIRAEEKVRQKMRDIIIPEIDFHAASIEGVIDFIQQESVENDPDGKGVNIILNLGRAGGGDAGDAGGGDGFEFFPEDGAGDSGGGSDKISFRAREINLLEALRIVTEVANLIFRIQGSVVMVLPWDAPDGLIIHRDYDVLPTLGDTVERVSVDFGGGGGDRGGDFIALDAGGFDTPTTDWKAFFEELGVKWPRGSSIRHIPAIGKLLVANTAQNLAIFETRLTEIDVIPKQIEIETRFVEVNQTDLNSIGFEYFITDDVELAQKKNQAGLPLSQRERLVLRAGAPTGGNRFLTNPDAQGSGVDALSASDNILTFASLLTNPELTMVLHALEQKGNTDLLSAPKITTKSGEEAQIKVVTEYIYPSDYTVEPGVPPTVTAAGGATTLGTPPIVTPAEFETREVGVIMNVLPEVTPDSQMISLTMSPEVVTEPEWRNFGQTFLDGAGNLQQIPIEQPFFNSRSISTSILIYNGATVVMGGMITEEREQVRDQIPVLGDIPIIGRFFRSSYDSSVKRNLLIFVTARLVGPDGRPVGGSITDSLP